MNTDTATHILTVRYANTAYETVIEGTPKELRRTLDVATVGGPLNKQWTKQGFISVDMLATMYAHKLSLDDIQDCYPYHIIMNKIEMRPELMLAKIKQEQEELRAKQKQVIISKPIQAAVAKAISTSYVANTQHKAINIELYTHTTVTCKETGITEQHKIASIASARLNLSHMHVLSRIENVKEFLQSYEKQGIQIEKHETPQVLAGMLITFLRSYRILHSNDFVLSNLALQQAKPETLGYALRYFLGVKSILAMPSLRMLNEALHDFAQKPTQQSNIECIKDRIELSLHQFIKDCRGENEGQTKYPSIRVESGSKVKIYGSNIARETKQLSKNIDRAWELLEEMNEEFEMTPVEYKRLENRIEGLEHRLDKTKRDMIAKWIRGRFQGNLSASLLAKIFETTSTELRDTSMLTPMIEIQIEREEKGQQPRTLMDARNAKIQAYKEQQAKDQDKEQS